MERWTGTPEGTCNVLRMFRETHAISARSSSTTRQKDRRQEKPHSVRFFCFHWISNHSHCEWFPQSLLDFLESRAMKRKSINHCAIRDRTLRNGTLDRNAGRDSERVVRTFRETHAISVRSSSTSRMWARTQLLGYEKRRLETNHWRQITQRTACSRADICRSGRRFCLFEFNFEDVSHCAMWARLKPLHIPLNAPWNYHIW